MISTGQADQVAGCRPAAAADPSRPARLHITIALAVALVLLRCALFLVRPEVSFDSDQAVIGLMAKHIMEGRAFPLFLYGQNYILAIEPLLAAPVFRLAGVSIAALKLPLVAVNVAVAVLLVRLLWRECGIQPMFALAASLFFLVPPIGTSAALTEAMGGNVEPFLYVLLLWMLRTRPAWFGLVAGIGFLQREFTVYGVFALFVVEACAGEWREGRRWAAQWAIRLGVAAATWAAILRLRPFTNPAGPGTTMASLHAASNDVLEVAGRICFSPRMTASGLWKIVTVHWPALFGTAVIPLTPFMVSDRMQGIAWSWLVPSSAAALMAARVAWLSRRDRGSAQRVRFAAYLLLVGGCSAMMYAVARCGAVSVWTLRYDLLSIVAAVGLAGWFFGVERNAAIVRLSAALITAWALLMVPGHLTVWREYWPRRPANAKVQIVHALEARGVQYATADYWLAYYIDFLTNERIIVASDGLTRIPWYEQQVEAHRSEAIRIDRKPCSGGQPVDGVYFCRP